MRNYTIRTVRELPYSFLEGEDGIAFVPDFSRKNIDPIIETYYIIDGERTDLDINYGDEVLPKHVQPIYTEVYRIYSMSDYAIIHQILNPENHTPLSELARTLGSDEQVNY